MFNETKVYIESYCSRKEQNIVEYAIDFNSIAEAEELFNVIGLQSEYTPLKFYKFIVPYYGVNRMFAGSWYYLPHFLFENASYESLDENTEGSAVFSGVITLNHFPVVFSLYLTHVSNNIDTSVQNFNTTFNSAFNKLVVVDCGQGNWNEVYNNDEILIYDLGASTTFTQNQVQALVNQRFSMYGGMKIDIIISHWDMDHFQSLKYLTPTQLSLVNAVYGPDNIPSTNVYTDAIDNLSKNGVKCYLIAPTTFRQGKCIDLNLLSSTNYVDYFRAVKGCSRNQTGIVLAIKGKRNIALLTGDHHYQKIFNAIFGHYTNRHIILVAPHHGGDAGSLLIQTWQNEFVSVKCPISVGPNSYGHPFQNLNNLTQLQRSSPDITEYSGNLTYVL